MRNTPDLTVVQEINIDTLRPRSRKVAEGHHWRGWLFAKCYFEAYPREDDWESNVWQEKVHHDEGWRFWRKNGSRMMWAKAGVSAPRATTNRRVRAKGYDTICRIPRFKPLLNYRRRQMRLIWGRPVLSAENETCVKIKSVTPLMCYCMIILSDQLLYFDVL
jgi:hypothetical protein